MNSNEMNYLESEDYVFKFVIIGDSGVGKSCIMHLFIFNKCIKIFKIKLQSKRTQLKQLVSNFPLN